MSMAVRSDEIDLWAAIVGGETMRAAASRLGVPARRAEYLAGKWARHGWYNWGVVYDLGWVEGRGPTSPDSVTTEG